MRSGRVFFLLFLASFPLLEAVAQGIDSTELMKDVAVLSSPRFWGRRMGTTGGRITQFYLQSRFGNLGLEPVTDSTYLQPFTYRDSIAGANVLGKITGADSSIIVVSAHFDHVGLAEGSLHPGADDNASGTSAILAIAAYFKAHPPRHTLVFAAFDGEELGMIGSRFFVARPPVNLKAVELNVNLDMIGTSTERQLFVAGTKLVKGSKAIVNKQASAFRRKLSVHFGYDVEQRPDNRMDRSDHASFYYLAKKPILYFGVPEHKNYHMSTDTFDNLSHDFYYNAATFILRVIVALDNRFPE